MTVPGLVDSPPISYNDNMAVVQPSSSRHQRHWPRLPRRHRAQHGTDVVAAPSAAAATAVEPHATEQAERMVLRGDTSIQPVSVPFIGLREPRLHAAQIERAAQALVVVSFALFLGPHLYPLAAIAAVLGAVCTVVAQPWVLFEAHRGVVRTGALALTVSIAIVASSTMSVVDLAHHPSTAVRTAVDAAHPPYGLVGTPTPPIFDITGGTCTIDGSGVVHAVGTITNLVNRTKTFDVTVSFTNAGGTVLTTGSGRIEALAPHGVASFDASAPLDQPPARCTISSVTTTS